MKILCLPDLHAFPTAYDRPLEDGLTTRMADWEETAKALIDLAVREKVDVAVAPGDYFMNARPPARAIISVTRLFQGLEDAGITVFGCQGNHDVAGPGQAGPVDVIAEFEPRWGCTKPEIWVDPKSRRLQVAVLPWVKPSALLHEAEGSGDLVSRTTDALLAIIRALGARVRPEVPSILIGHWALSGARLSSGEHLTGGEPAIPVSELAALPFRAVIMGHIHRPQILADGGGGPVVLHTGAFQRIDFGEEDDPRGAWVVDLETGETEWYDLPARRFVTWRLTQEQVGALANGLPAHVALAASRETEEQVRDAICRVVYRATEEVATKIDHADLIRSLERAGAHHVAGVFPEIVRSERARAEGLTEQTSPLVALDRWLALRSDLTDELRTEVRTEAQKLLAHF